MQGRVQQRKTGKFFPFFFGKVEHFLHRILLKKNKQLEYGLLLSLDADIEVHGKFTVSIENKVPSISKYFELECFKKE